MLNNFSILKIVENLNLPFENGFYKDQICIPDFYLIAI